MSMWPECTAGQARCTIISERGKLHLSHADWCQFHLNRGGVNPGLLGIWEDSLGIVMKKEG